MTKLDELKNILNQDTVEIDVAEGLARKISQDIRDDRSQMRARDAASKLARTISEVKDGRPNVSPQDLLKLVEAVESKLR